MKVVFLADDFPPLSFGGAGISTYELAKGVQEVGHEVTVISTCRKTEDAGAGQFDGLSVIRIKSDYHERWRAWVSLYNPPVVREMKKILNALQPDIVHVNNVHFYLSYACLAVAKRRAKAVVWTARDAMAVSFGKLATERYFTNLDPHLSWRDHMRQAGKRYNPLRNFLIRKYLQSVDIRFAVSGALVQVLEANGVTGVEVLHTGIDSRTFDIPSETVLAFRKKYGLEGKSVILYGGRLGSGPQVLEAMRLTAQKAGNSILLVMGKEESTERLKAASTGLPIIYTGWLSGTDKIAAYCISDIVWVPSTYFDAFPRSALEASAAGKPVITSPYGGAKELVIDGETGYIADPFKPHDLADRTVELLRDAEKARAFGRTGRERIEKRFNLKDTIKILVDRYRVLLG